MTFSIVGRDTVQEQLGVAIATARPAVGGRCLLARSGLVVATQGWVATELANRVDALVRGGADCAAAVEASTAADPEQSVRQLLALSPTGGPSVHSGTDLPLAAGEALAVDAACAGNQLGSVDVPAQMLASFEAQNTGHVDLADRLLCSLQVGDETGGDRRGRQSAALRVVPWAGAWPGIDLRVDDHPDPVGELERLLDLWRGQWGVYDRTGQFPPVAPAWSP